MNCPSKYQTRLLETAHLALQQLRLLGQFDLGVTQNNFGQLKRHLDEIDPHTESGLPNTLTTIYKPYKLLSFGSGFVVLQFMNNPLTPLSDIIQGYFPTQTALLLAVQSNPQTQINNYFLTFIQIVVPPIVEPQREEFSCPKIIDAAKIITASEVESFEASIIIAIMLFDSLPSTLLPNSISNKLVRAMINIYLFYKKQCSSTKFQSPFIPLNILINLSFILHIPKTLYCILFKQLQEKKINSLQQRFSSNQEDFVYLSKV
ncbi:unnamed protein product [Paramecium sonneborni]|uniref:Uncharacterized protein n=1 Tax=Paramecium sonneborni TaxID=65129 RepID=A0A8S1NRT4_9CILI|nr:unnamed protein product [Paramecium sonneborni]